MGSRCQDRRPARQKRRLARYNDGCGGRDRSGVGAGMTLDAGAGMKGSATTQRRGAVSIKRVTVRSSGPKGARNMPPQSAEGATSAIPTIPDSKYERAVSYRFAPGRTISPVSGSTPLSTFPALLGPLWRATRSILRCYTTTGPRNTSNARGTTLSARWAGGSSGLSSKTSIKATRNFGFRLSPDS